MKSEKLLESFTKYCEDHPDQRFWQALGNWVGWPFLYVSSLPRDCIPGDVMEDCEMLDTFYWEDNVKYND